MKNAGVDLYQKAKELIPGGTQLLSKRPEMFLPNKWPSYYSKAKGGKIRDLNGNEYKDFITMGIGACVLGYADDDIDNAVVDGLRKGNMTSLNAPEEVELAELFTSIHPWSDMVRYTRSGGEALTVAVRIGRAASGKDKVMFCGYHGWHDWYLSANLGDDDSLSGHLLPGLSPNGVPSSMRGVVHPFNYNDLAALEKIVARGDVGVIKMEVVRNKEPKDGFLQKVRDLADRNNIVLIFDECTSGFRQTFGGLHKLYGVEPDMAMFGKALGSAPIVLVNHALTGNSDVAGKNGWWLDLVGDDKVIDTKLYTILAFNIPGNGFDGFVIDNYKDFVASDVAYIFLRGF